MYPAAPLLDCLLLVGGEGSRRGLLFCSYPRCCAHSEQATTSLTVSNPIPPGSSLTITFPFLRYLLALSRLGYTLPRFFMTTRRLRIVGGII